MPRGPLRRGGLLALKPSPCSSFGEMPPWPDVQLCHSVHELHIMYRKALLKMLSQIFPWASAHMESPAWVFTISHVTEMSAGPWITGGFGAREGHDQIC